MNRLIITLAFIVAFVGFGFSQNGSITGNVIDKDRGETLIGATIIIEGTTTGTTTDFDGNYTLKGLTPGTYSIVCSFISYEPIKVTGVEVKPNTPTVINFSLREATIGLEEVVVSARAVQKTEQALLTLQRKSANVLDGISAQQISRIGDNDAAGALKRVTGISVEGGKYVYVRGLSDRYSITTLNKAEIPGLDPNRNTVQMDLFPSNIIENMVVSKTFSPELPGSFSGGYVNIVTKDFPEKFTFQLSMGMGYNSNSNLKNDFLLYKGGKTDWLAFDDGTRAMPNEAKGQIPYLYENDAKLTQITRSFSKQMAPEQVNSFLNQSYSISMGNKKELLGRDLGYLVSLTYQNDFSQTNNGETNRYKLTDKNSQYLVPELVLPYDLKGNQEVLWGAMGTVNYKLNNNNKVGVVLIHNQSGQSSARMQEGRKPSDGDMHYQTRTLQYLQRGFTSYQIKGEHVLPTLGKTKIEWLSSYTVSTQDEPDLRFFTNSYAVNGTDTVYSINPTLYPVPTRYFRNMEESNRDNKLDIEIPVKIAGKTGKVMLGGAAVLKNRAFREKSFTYRENSNTFNGNITEYFADENLHAPDGIYISNSKSTNEKNSYDGEQLVAAGYSLLDLSLTSKLRANVGARVEHTNILTQSLRANVAKGEITSTDILPALNLTYSATEKTNFRLAASRTLARPSFRELAPYASLDFVGDFVFVGNANLDRTLIDNFDLRWETFMNSGEIISLSVFYKMFHNPIERTFNTEAANPELTLRNVDEASLYGLEIEFRKNLDFAQITKDFKVGLNLTLVKSQVSIDSKELELKRHFDPSFSNTRVMFGQSPYIVNAHLGYSNEKNGISANLAYNISGERLYLVNATGVPDVYETPRGQMDFNISKTFAQKYSLKLSAKNLLDSPYKQTYEYGGKEYVFSNYSLGRTFSFSISYSF